MLFEQQRFAAASATTTQESAILTEGKESSPKVHLCMPNGRIDLAHPELLLVAHRVLQSSLKTLSTAANKAATTRGVFWERSALLAKA
jgi:hypothetical protein